MVRQIDLTAPAELLRVMIEGTLPFDGYLARRAALRLTGRIPALDLAAGLHGELFAELDLILTRNDLCRGSVQTAEPHRLGAMAALTRIIAVGRQ